jgi:tetratricopeptide (TPR) repeat protein
MFKSIHPSLRESLVAEFIGSVICYLGLGALVWVGLQVEFNWLSIDAALCAAVLLLAQNVAYSKKLSALSRLIVEGHPIDATGKLVRIYRDVAPSHAVLGDWSDISGVKQEGLGFFVRTPSEKIRKLFKPASKATEEMIGLYLHPITKLPIAAVTSAGIVVASFAGDSPAWVHQVSSCLSRQGLLKLLAGVGMIYAVLLLTSGFIISPQNVLGLTAGFGALAESDALKHCGRDLLSRSQAALPIVQWAPRLCDPNSNFYPMLVLERAIYEHDAGDCNQAVETLSQAIELRQRRNPVDPALVNLLSQKALYCSYLHKFYEATQAANEFVAVKRHCGRALNDIHPAWLQSRPLDGPFLRAWVLIGNGEYEQAAVICDRTFEQEKQLYKSPCEEAFADLRTLEDAYKWLGADGKARQIFMWRRNLSRTTSNTSWQESLDDASYHCNVRNQPAVAQIQLDLVFEQLKGVTDVTVPRAKALLVQGQIYCQQKRFSDGLKSYRSILELPLDRLGLKIEALNGISEIDLATHDVDAAESINSLAIDLSKRNLRCFPGVGPEKDLAVALFLRAKIAAERYSCERYHVGTEVSAASVASDYDEAILVAQYLPLVKRQIEAERDLFLKHLTNAQDKVALSY